MKSKIVIGILLGALFVLILVLIFQTMTYPFAKPEIETRTQAVSTPVPEQSLRRFAGGIRIPTISNEIYEETDFEPFDAFMAYLPVAYPAVYQTLETDTVNKYGLIFHWKGKDSSLPPILFLSHYDVVPVIGYDPAAPQATDTIFRPGDPPVAAAESIAQNWDYPPFSGAVVNGRIYGRGTLDMKCMLFALMEGADALIAEGFQPERDIWFAFGHDEEVGGKQGAIKIAAYFKEKGLRFDAIYDEGGIIAAPGSAMESIHKPLGLVGIGEKGFLTLRLKVKGLGGHSSMPPAKSSLVYAAEVIEKLNSHQMQARIISPIASFLKNIGGEMGFVSRMAIANQWLLEPMLLRTFEKSPSSNALVRTTTAVTMAKGSDAPNVLSSVSEVTVNFRILPGETIADVLRHVENLLSHYEYEMEIVSQREPSGISPEKVRGFEIIKEKMARIHPDAIVTSYITIGGTDAYKYQSVSDRIYRFLPIELNTFEQRTIHNENEHITVENFGKMLWYFKELMKTY